MKPLLCPAGFFNPRRMQSSILLLAALFMPLQAVGQGVGQVENPPLDIGDTVQLSVHGRPDWDLVLIIDGEGRVAIPQVGQIALAGLSLQDAHRILQQRLRIFDPELATIQLELGNIDSITIQIQGAVNMPGTFTFESPPSVWDLARRGGGVLENADLGLARVIREESGAARIYPLDLSALVVGGRIPEFTFQSGDVLLIPEGEFESVVPHLGTGTQVFGAVLNPAIVQLNSPRPLLEVLMLAGSPLERAKLSEIWLVHTEAGRFRAKKVDLTRFLKKGNLVGNPTVYPGDTVNVPYQEDGWYRRNGPLFLGAMTAAATIFLAYDRISE
ncbi:MAG: SLBB domain-containing protein [Gemmatimonadales bacterium]|nr:SLBB domain-containing protein [Gemmatimonadales bacterium]